MNTRCRNVPAAAFLAALLAGCPYEEEPVPVGPCSAHGYFNESPAHTYYRFSRFVEGAPGGEREERFVTTLAVLPGLLWIGSCGGGAFEYDSEFRWAEETP